MVSKLKGTARLRRLKTSQEDPDDKRGKKLRVHTHPPAETDSRIDVEKLRRRLGIRLTA